MVRRESKMKAGNKGLTVRVNLFALDRYRDDFDAESATLWMKGSVVNVDTKEKVIFNDAGKLISTLGRWNAAKFRAGGKHAASN